MMGRKRSSRRTQGSQACEPAPLFNRLHGQLNWTACLSITRNRRASFNIFIYLYSSDIFKWVLNLINKNISFLFTTFISWCLCCLVQRYRKRFMQSIGLIKCQSTWRYIARRWRWRHRLIDSHSSFGHSQDLLAALLCRGDYNHHQRRCG